MGVFVGRLVVTVLIFLFLVIGVPLTYMYLHGDLSNQKATGLGAVAGGPGVLLVLSVALLVSAIVSTLIVRD